MSRPRSLKGVVFVLAAVLILSAADAYARPGKAGSGSSAKATVDSKNKRVNPESRTRRAVLRPHAPTRKELLRRAKARVDKAQRRESNAYLAEVRALKEHREAQRGLRLAGATGEWVAGEAPSSGRGPRERPNPLVWQSTTNQTLQREVERAKTAEAALIVARAERRAAYRELKDAREARNALARGTSRVPEGLGRTGGGRGARGQGE